MIPTLRRMFCLLAFALGAGGALLAGMPSLTQARPVVRVAIFPHEPGTFLDAQGRPTGLFVDVLREVADREGWELQFRLVPWAQTLELARKGEVDLITTVARNPEREAFLDFGAEPAYTMWTLLYVAKGSHLEDVTALRGRTVALMRGDRNGQQFVAFCQRIDLPCTFQEVGSFDEVLAAVAGGKADAGVTSSLYGYWHEGRFAVHRTPVVLNPFPVHFAGPKGRSQAYLAAVDRFLAEARAKEASPFHGIRDRWLHPQETRTLPPWIQKGLLLLLGLLALAAGAVILFQRQVRLATAKIRDLNAQLSSELDARKRSESRLDTLARLNADFLFACHHEGAAFRQREWITDAFYRLTGYTEGDLEQHGCWLFAAHPEDRPAVEAAFAALAPGARDTRAFRLLTRDGRVRWVRCHTEVESGGSGDRARRLGSVEDITEQVEAERRLSDSRQELQAVYDQAPVSLCVLNADLRVVFANQAFLALAGRPEEAVLAHRLGAVLGCPLASTAGGCGAATGCGACDLLRAAEATRATGASSANIIHRLQPPGCPEPVHLLGATRRIEGPAGHRVLLSLLDITELKRTEKALQEARSQYQTIVDACPTAILVSHGGRYTFANPAAAELLGYPDPQDLAGRPVAAVILPQDLERVRDRIARNASGHSNPPMVLPMRRADGSEVATESRSVPIHTAEGPASLVLAEDISDRLRVEILQRTRFELSEYARRHTLQELLQRTLDLVEDLTRSRLASFHFVDEGQATLRLQAWSTRTQAFAGAPASEGTQEPLEQAGLRADALRQRRSIIHNDDTASAGHGGFPEGHAPVQRELVVPIFRGGQAAGILGLGNKPEPYTPHDLDLAEQIANLAWDIIDGKRQAEALAQSEERLRLALEATSDGLWDWNLEAGTLYLSPRALTMLGHPADTPVNRIEDVFALLHPEEREALRADLAAWAEGPDGAWVREFRLRQAGGGYTWVLSRGRKVAWNEAGQAVRVLGTHVDLSERKAAEEALLEREQRLQRLSEVTEVGLVIHDGGEILEVNDAALRMCGLEHPARLIGRSLMEMIAPEDRALVRQHASTAGDHAYEVHALRASGEAFPVRVISRAMPWFGRNARVASIQDLTTLQHLESALAHQAHRFDLLFRYLPGALFQWRIRPGGQNSFDTLSPQAKATFGLEPSQEDPARHLAARLHPEDQARFLESLDQAVSKREEWDFDGRILEADGRIRWFHGQSFPVAEGGDLVFHGILLDTTDRMATLEALIDREARLNAIFDQAAVGLILADARGATLQANEEAQRLFGCSLNGLAGRSFRDLTHPEDLPRELPLAEAIFQGDRSSYALEKRLLRADGSSFWANVHISRIFEPNRERTRFLAVISDIDGRKRAEQALAESEARFRNLFHTHNAPFLLLDPETGEIVDANAAAQAYYGYTGEELKTLNIRDINALPPEEMERERRKATRKEQNYFIFPHRLKSGEIRTVEVYASPVPIQGRPLLFSIVHDVTERVEVEDALRRSERRFRLLMDASSDAVFLYGFGEDGQPAPFIEVSRAACALLGHSREDLLGLTVLDLLPSRGARNLPNLENMHRHPGPLIQETSYRARDGRLIPVEVSRRLIKVDQQPMVLAIARDITERKRAQALDTATEGILAKGRMAAYIAHEINNPLAGIKSAFRLVAEAVPSDNPHRRYVDLIHQEITRIGNIVKTMYELYKPASTTPTDILVEAVLQDVGALLAPKARAHRAEVALEIPDPLLRATVQSDLLRQILFNLVQNALEASPPQGHVTCLARSLDGRLQIQVVDEGTGIPPDIAPRIFDSGFSTKHAAGGQMGLGLGLGSARKLAEGMGGALTFANNPGGKGCTFTLDLPLIQHGAT